MAMYASDGSNAVCAGVTKNVSTRRESVRLDRRKAKANANAEQNATAWRARTVAPTTRGATKAAVTAASPLARNVPP